MKVTIEKEELTLGVLSDFFSTALYGSLNFHASYDLVKYNPIVKNHACYEDRLAAILLSGGTIDFLDLEEEDEIYGTSVTKIHAYKDEHCVAYEVSLDDIKRGFERALSLSFYGSNDEGWIADIARDVLSGEYMYCDQPAADALLQVILFNEVIYG